MKARSADEIPEVMDAIDGTFMNSTAPTKTETEKAFVLGFMAMWGNVRTLVVSISTVVDFHNRAGCREHDGDVDP